MLLSNIKCQFLLTKQSLLLGYGHCDQILWNVKIQEEFFKLEIHLSLYHFDESLFANLLNHSNIFLHHCNL